MKFCHTNFYSRLASYRLALPVENTLTVKYNIYTQIHEYNINTLIIIKPEPKQKKRKTCLRAQEGISTSADGNVAVAGNAVIQPIPCS